MKKEKHIIPAIIAKNQEELVEKINKVKDSYKRIQLDFMDSEFVPNSSIFFDFKLPKSDNLYEAHLMVKDPVVWIQKNWQKVDTILIHFESNIDPENILKLVKKKGKRVGFVLNPETKIDSIKKYLDEIDQVLIMTVNPGFYGSPFLPETLDKIRNLRKIKPYLDIEVDGGITDKTISLVYEAGANMFVSGSFIVKSDDVVLAKNKLLEKINQ